MGDNQGGVIGRNLAATIIFHELFFRSLILGRFGFMDEIRLTLMEAIARQQIVETRYNGARIRLAPHLLFERHGDLFIGAFNLGKNWRAEDERRLGQFKLAGLTGAQLLGETFEPLPTYQPAAPRADDRLVLAI